MKLPTCLTIAGSDSSGGAGIQADLKTMTLNGVYAMSAIASLTAQNTTGVRDIYDVSPEFLAKEIDAIFEDIYPDAIKIGMVSSSALIEVIAERLSFYKAKNIVVDPVMVATSGSKLISDDAIATLVERLLPLATVITPNIPEAEVLLGGEERIGSFEAMSDAALEISQEIGCAVLVKGGHGTADASDVLYVPADKDEDEEGVFRYYQRERIDNPNTHGTGCTLSSAIAANLAKGFDLEESIGRAKDYVSGALAAMLDLGAGSGPLDHAFDLTSRFAVRPVHGSRLS